MILSCRYSHHLLQWSQRTLDNNLCRPTHSFPSKCLHCWSKGGFLLQASRLNTICNKPEINRMINLMILPKKVRKITKNKFVILIVLKSAQRVYPRPIKKVVQPWKLTKLRESPQFAISIVKWTCVEHRQQILKMSVVLRMEVFLLDFWFLIWFNSRIFDGYSNLSPWKYILPN